MKNKIYKFTHKLKWFLVEIMKMYSDEKSYFSKKRVESGVAFLMGQFGMLFFLIKRIDSMDVYDLSIWAAMEFIIAGYTVNQIQKEKKIYNNSENNFGNEN